MNQTTPRCCRCNFFIPSKSPLFETSFTSFGLLCMSCRREGAELREQEKAETETKVVACLGCQMTLELGGIDYFVCEGCTPAWERRPAHYDRPFEIGDVVELVTDPGGLKMTVESIDLDETPGSKCPVLLHLIWWEKDPSGEWLDRPTRYPVTAAIVKRVDIHNTMQEVAGNIMRDISEPLARTIKAPSMDQKAFLAELLRRGYKRAGYGIETRENDYDTKKFCCCVTLTAPDGVMMDISGASWEMVLRHLYQDPLYEAKIDPPKDLDLQKVRESYEKLTAPRMTAPNIRFYGTKPLPFNVTGGDEKLRAIVTRAMLQIIKSDPGWLASDEATKRTGTSVAMLTKPVKINVLQDAAGKITKVLPHDDEVHDDGGERESMPVGSRVFDTKNNRTGRVVSITEKKYWCQAEDSEECFTALEENLRLRDAATFHSFRDIGPATDVRDNIGNTTDGPGWVQDILDASEKEDPTDRPPPCGCGPVESCSSCYPLMAMRDEYNKLPIPFLCPKCSNLIARTDGNKTLIAECPAGLHSLAMDADVRFECTCGHEWTWSPKP